jgi:hypothetical protein
MSHRIFKRSMISIIEDQIKDKHGVSRISDAYLNEVQHLKDKAGFSETPEKLKREISDESNDERQSYTCKRARSDPEFLFSE